MLVLLRFLSTLQQTMWIEVDKMEGEREREEHNKKRRSNK